MLHWYTLTDCDASADLEMQPGIRLTGTDMGWVFRKDDAALVMHINAAMGFYRTTRHYLDLRAKYFSVGRECDSSDDDVDTKPVTFESIQGLFIIYLAFAGTGLLTAVVGRALRHGESKVDSAEAQLEDLKHVALSHNATDGQMLRYVVMTPPTSCSPLLARPCPSLPTGADHRRPTLGYWQGLRRQPTQPVWRLLFCFWGVFWGGEVGWLARAAHRAPGVWLCVPLASEIHRQLCCAGWLTRAHRSSHRGPIQVAAQNQMLEHNAALAMRLATGRPTEAGLPVGGGTTETSVDSTGTGTGSRAEAGRESLAPLRRTARSRDAASDA